MDHLIRFDNRFEDTGSASVEGFGPQPQREPRRPDPALTALVTGMALAVCIALTATVMSLGRVQSSSPAAPSMTDRPLALAAQPLHSRS